jgi:hypothetical protein
MGQFRSSASELIFPRIHTDTIEEVEKAASNLTASTAWHKLSTCKHTLSDLNNELPGLDHLLQLAAEAEEIVA